MAYAPANEISDLVDVPHITDQELIRHRTHPVLREYVIPAPSVSFSEREAEIHEASGVGEHTDAILELLGYGSDEIQALRADGVVTGDQ